MATKSETSAPGGAAEPSGASGHGSEAKATKGAQAGLYVAWHPWLDCEHGAGQLHKVGHTGDLSRRLEDSSYVTCFPPGWKYVATYETEGKDDAHLLESAVLHCCRDVRLGSRELVRAPAAALIGLVEAAATKLGVAGVVRLTPVYPATPSGGWLSGVLGGGRLGRLLSGGNNSASPGGDRTETTPDPGTEKLFSPRFDAKKKALVAPLRLGQASAEIPGTEPSLGSDLLDDIIMGWTAVEEPEARMFSTSESPATSPVQSPKTTTSKSIANTAAQPDDQFATDMDVDWADAAGRPLDFANPVAPPEERPYQNEAACRALAELRWNHRAIVQMACRSGKTMVAFKILGKYLEDKKAVLVLVPGLSLLRQTAQKLVSYGVRAPILLVGSDARPVKLADGREIVMTTDAALATLFVEGNAGATLTISTYQSSPNLPKDRYALTIFDECHRVCGAEALRPFNHVLSTHAAGDRVFMTATPAYEGALSMADKQRFGGIAYRYHLREGINAGYVNDFRLQLVAAQEIGGAPPSPGGTATTVEQIVAAMGVVDKLLVFCRDIQHATQLSAATEKEMAKAAQPFGCMLAHSRMGSKGVAAALRNFSEPGRRAALFNCRLFQEGVEIPALNGVFFAAPRHSPRDIIQSICRPLNRTEGKGVSVVFLPIAHDPTRPATDPANLKKYAAIVPFVDALLDEDPRLYEHLLNPAKNSYPIDCLGTHSLALPKDADKRALLAAVRRAARFGASTAERPVERLLRAERIPWQLGFAELSRIVNQCNRYPKTTDLWVIGEARVKFHNFYRWCAENYRNWKEGRPTLLEPHQLRDLEGLRHWDPYGIEGPYPWKICIDFLEQWIREHGSPPMIEVNRGGYVGLDASGMERLSGAMTCINQGDGKARQGRGPRSGFVIDAGKQADLDRLCAEFGLRWRKERGPDGDLVEGGPPTFIQEAHRRFKDYYKEHGPNGDYIVTWFSGFPVKHDKQESLEVLKNGTAPLKLNGQKRVLGKDAAKRVEETAAAPRPRDAPLAAPTVALASTPATSPVASPRPQNGLPFISAASVETAPKPKAAKSPKKSGVRAEKAPSPKA